MLCYDRIDISKSIDVNNTSTSKEFIICHHRYFSEKVFRFQPTICTSCLPVSMFSFGTNNVTVLYIHDIDYCWIIFEISTNGAIYILFRMKKMTLCKIWIFFFLVLKIKNENINYELKNENLKENTQNDEIAIIKKVF